MLGCSCSWHSFLCLACPAMPSPAAFASTSGAKPPLVLPNAPLTALGDLFIFKKTYPWPVWACLSLMIASAVVGASTDSRFTWVGYSWQIANCLFTSAYALHLRSVMDRVTDYTTDGGKVGGGRSSACPKCL